MRTSLSHAFTGDRILTPALSFPRGSYSRSPSRRREDEESHGTLTPGTSRPPTYHDLRPDPSDELLSPRTSSQYDHYDHYDNSSRNSFSAYDDYDGEVVQAVEYAGPAMPAAKPTDLRVDINPSNPASPQPGFPSRSTSIRKGVSKLLNPKSPSVKSPDTGKSPEKGSFWSWGKNRQNSNMESPSTQFSDGTPLSAEQQTPHQPTPSPKFRDDDHYFGSEVDYSPRSASPNPYATTGLTTNVTELLKELQEVSAELASSIRREMDLEDELDRIHTDLPNAPVTELSRRTSDYYSDSGASSIKLPPADTDLKLQGLEQMRRKAEQEKAQLRVDMAQKVQEDLNQRRALEMHVHSLEEQLEAASSTRELEAQLEDYKRKLHDEKEFKANFDDLLAGMREEIEEIRNDRDNLRDEVVPKLRAQIEGMETETSEAQNLTYENTRLQQELQNLKNENATLQNARRLQSSFRTISEEGETSPSSPTLSRSNSLARSRSTRARSGSLVHDSREATAAQPEALPERLKNLEEQRDALHRTLKSLLLRQDQLHRRHTKRISALETERDRALANMPRRQAFHVEVQSLRSEISTLRQRADEALEQKFQCEKGLSGLKMDLDRAQQETTSLRELLQEHDIPDPTSTTGSLNSSPSHTPSDSQDSLDRAYAELREAHADSLAAGHESDAESRMHALASQVSAQQTSNHELHARLAEAIERGENEQAASAQKINELQAALRSAEERVMAAQTASEEAIDEHEATAKDLKDAVNDQQSRGMGVLNRHALPDKLQAGLALSSKTIGSTANKLFGGKAPRLSQTATGQGQSIAQVVRTARLEERVKELEDAAVSAEKEMQGVVERMNKAQIEVAELQAERDEAQKLTKALREEIRHERERVGKWG